MAAVVRKGPLVAKLAVILLLLPFWLTSELRQTSWPPGGKVAAIAGLWLLTVTTAVAAPSAELATVGQIAESPRAPAPTSSPTPLSTGRFEAAPSGWPTPSDNATEAFVTEVTDGDTIVLSGIDVGKPHASGGRSARLIGIDTPEVHGSQECFGAEASAFTKRELDREQVLVEFDVEKVDRYDRALVYVWHPNGRFFNGRLAAEGYAQQLTIPPNVKRAELFTRLVREAREGNRGLWQGCDNAPILPGQGPTTGGAESGDRCHPSYSPQCLDPTVSDYDCAGGGGNGPAYVDGPVDVTGSDPYGLDVDNDGVGCERGRLSTTPTPPPQRPPPTAQPTPAPGGGGNCHPSYPDFCIAPPPPDLDCDDVNRSDFTVRHDVSNPDPHGFDGNDNDGIGCES